MTTQKSAANFNIVFNQMMMLAADALSNIQTKRAAYHKLVIHCTNGPARQEGKKHNVSVRKPMNMKFKTEKNGMKSSLLLIYTIELEEWLCLNFRLCAIFWLNPCFLMLMNFVYFLFSFVYNHCGFCESFHYIPIRNPVSEMWPFQKEF